MKFNFPIGYHELHQESIINFQLNRWISLGVANLEELKEISPKIRNFGDWKRVFIEIADKALSEGRLVNAAFYYRAAEFFLSPKDPDKEVLYDKFITLFYEAFKDEPFERDSIPYKNGSISSIRIQQKDAKGTIVVHGGFDSFIEELYPIISFFTNHGYEVIMFDGPGQGATLKKHGLTLTPYWEEPVKAILDFYNLDNVILLGISLGGYLAIRAAAYEKRIAKVIAYDVVYDMTQSMLANYRNRIIKALVSFLLRIISSKSLNRKIEKKMEDDLHARWAYEHGMYVTGTSSPYEFLKHLQQYSVAKISSNVVQDVLLMAGEEDHAIPVEMFHKQKKALKNARSVTGRIFTKEENAASHCQSGNLPLALGYILEWLEGKIRK